MNLKKKKQLAIRTLDVGEARIAFVGSRTKDIKEAITKQDIRDLVLDGAILIKEVKGRRKVVKKKSKRSPGNVKKKVNKRKENYMIMTRKLRRYVKGIKSQGQITRDESLELRKKIRNKLFKSLAHLKEHIGGNKK